MVYLLSLTAGPAARFHLAPAAVVGAMQGDITCMRTQHLTVLAAECKKPALVFVSGDGAALPVEAALAVVAAEVPDPDGHGRVQ